MLIVSRIFFNFYKYKRKIHTTVKLCSYENRNYENLNILFFGTDKFSLPSLDALHKESVKNSKISSVGVVTSFKGSINSVRAYAVERNLKLYKWAIEENDVNGYDLGVVVSFGHLIPNKVISAFPLGMINVHASILPRWRGAAPIIYALMHGDQTTGVSIMKIEPKHFDIGDVLAQKEIIIKPNICLPELHDELAREGARLLIETIKEVPQCLKKGRRQEESLVTYAPKVDPLLAEVRWTEMTAQSIYNLFRALFSYKELKTKFQNYIIKIVELNISKDTEKGSFPPGFIEYCKTRKCLKVYCKDDSCVEIRQVKVEGKRTMSATDFSNGFLNKYSAAQRYFK